MRRCDASASWSYNVGALTESKVLSRPGIWWQEEDTADGVEVAHAQPAERDINASLTNRRTLEGSTGEEAEGKSKPDDACATGFRL